MLASFLYKKIVKVYKKVQKKYCYFGNNGQNGGIGQEFIMKGEMKTNESVFKGNFFTENGLHFYKNSVR